MSAKIQEDQHVYIKCMNGIKDRFQILELVNTDTNEGKNVDLASAELAFLQMRKIYEAISFSALAANKAQFEKIWKKYSKEWNLASVLDRIRKLNPDYIPVPIDVKKIPNLAQ